MKNFKQKNKEARYQILYDYRQKLMQYPDNFGANAATNATAKQFNTTIMTVYRAIRYVRSNKKGATE